MCRSARSRLAATSPISRRALEYRPGSLIVLGIPTAAALWFLFARTLPLALGRMAPSSPFRQGIIVTVSVVIMFGYFGLVGLVGYDETSHVLSVLSLCLIPAMLILCWPTRRWMRARMEASKAGG